MDNQEAVQSEEDTQHGRAPDLSLYRKGEMLFAIITIAIAVFLFSQIRTQTKWVENISFFQQPRFWPILCLSGFLLFAIGYLIQSILKARRQKSVSLYSQILPFDEVWLWVRTLEYSFYFLLYVFMVPKLGYLPSTLIFCPLLTLREGYRTKKIVIGSMLAGFCITIVFKAILKVKLPAGDIYNVFPDTIRNFLMIYF